MKNTNKYLMLMVILPALIIIGVLSVRIGGTCTPDSSTYNVKTASDTELLDVDEYLLILTVDTSDCWGEAGFVPVTLTYYRFGISFEVFVGPGVDIFLFNGSDYDTWISSPSESGASEVNLTGIEDCLSLTSYPACVNTTIRVVIANMNAPRDMVIQYEIVSWANSVPYQSQTFPGFEPFVYIALFGFIGVVIILGYRMKFKNAFK